MSYYSVAEVTRTRGRSCHQQGRPTTELQKSQEPEVVHTDNRDVLAGVTKTMPPKGHLTTELQKLCLQVVTFLCVYDHILYNLFSVSCAHIFVMYD